MKSVIDIEKEQDVKDALKVINQAKTESQNFFEKTVSIVDKVDQEFDRIDKELKEFEDSKELLKMIKERKEN